MVVWILGKSGSGKTLFAKQLFDFLKNKRVKTKWLDGDKFRNIYSKDLGYTIKDRRKNSIRIQNYCKKFEKKNYVIICSITSIFPEHQKKNRSLFKKYIQVNIKTNFKTLKKRNNKKIYDKKKDVVGVHIKYLEPFMSDITIKNNFDKKFITSIKKTCLKIYEYLSKVDSK